MNFNKINVMAIIIVFLGISNQALSKQAAVIIDVDDTLMDTRGRTREILLNLGVKNNIPELATLTLEKTDSSCHKTCANVGMRDNNMITEICGDPKGDTESGSLWGRKFFLDEVYLRYDHVVPGSVAFINRIAKEIPVHIVYLSGRKKEYMLKTTEDQLKFHNFPIAKAGTNVTAEIILKPEDAINNAEFKKQAINGLLKKYKVIFAIDDNVKNVNLFREMLDKDAVVVRVSQDVTNFDGMNKDISQITNFYFNVKNKGDLKTMQANNQDIEKIMSNLKNLANQPSQIQADAQGIRKTQEQAMVKVL